MAYGSALFVASLLAAAPVHAATGCEAGPAAAAAANGASLTTLAWAPFHRPETGWATYYPRIATTIGTRCPPDTPGFAAALASWQQAHRIAATGLFDPASFDAMKAGWQALRPFVAVSTPDKCPPPPPVSKLAAATPAEGYGGKLVVLRAKALAAWRRMVSAARRAVPAIAQEPRALTLFSGFRDPDTDAARCARDGNCDGVVRAQCSAHRTGLAIDLWVGQAPGFGPDSSADANRRFIARTPEYRWLVANARRYGFVNYAFEPWHWEWTGEPI